MLSDLLHPAPSLTTASHHHMPIVNCNSGQILITSGRLELQIDQTTGFLNGLAFDGQQKFKQPMQPNFWRPTTDNDYGWQAEKRLSMWKTAGCPVADGGSYRLEDGTGVEIAQLDGCVHVTFCALVLPAPDQSRLATRYNSY